MTEKEEARESIQNLFSWRINEWHPIIDQKCFLGIYRYGYIKEIIWESDDHVVSEDEMDKRNQNLDGILLDYMNHKRESQVLSNQWESPPYNLWANKFMYTLLNNLSQWLKEK